MENIPIAQLLESTAREDVAEGLKELKIVELADLKTRMLAAYNEAEHMIMALNKEMERRDGIGN